MIVHVPQLARLDRSGNQNAFLIPTQIQVNGLCLQTEVLADSGEEISLTVSNVTEST